MTTPPAVTEHPTSDRPAGQYATFPRRLNAVTIDFVLLIGFSALVFAITPAGDELPWFRLGLGGLWWGALLFYEPVTVACWGGTVGHRLLNIRVVDDHTGGNLGIGKAVARFWIKVVLGILSFLSMSLTRRHQAIHDVLTRSTVQIRDPAKAAPHHYVTESASKKP